MRTSRVRVGVGFAAHEEIKSRRKKANKRGNGKARSGVSCSGE